MATEDHDIAEINHITVFSKKFEYATEYKGKSGKLSLNEFANFKATVFDVLGDSEYAKEIIQIISKAYADVK
jgi:uncharacterized protein YllA (UPF0747 family)